MKKVGTKELYEMILIEMFDVERIKQDVLNKIIPDDVKPQFEAISAIVKEFSDKLDSVTLEDLQDFSEQTLSIDLKVLIKIKDEFLNNLTSKYKSSKDLKAMTQEFIKVVKAAKKNSDSQTMPEEIKRQFEAFTTFIGMFDENSKYDESEIQQAERRAGTKIEVLKGIYDDVMKEMGHPIRKYQNFFNIVKVFPVVLDKIEANKEPEQSDEEKDLQAKLKLFRKFEQELKNLGKKLSESFILEQDEESKISREDLEKAAENAGTNLEELKKIAQELQAADSILQTTSGPDTDELKNIVIKFNKVSRQTRTADDVFEDVLSTYEGIFREKYDKLVAAGKTREAEEYLKKSQNFKSLLSKSFEQKEPELDPEVEQEVKKELGFAQEYELLKRLISDVVKGALGQKNIRQELELEYMSEVTTTAAVGWLAGLGALVTSPVALIPVALGGAAIIVWRMYSKNKKKKKALKRQISKSITYGIEAFIKTVYDATKEQVNKRPVSKEESIIYVKNIYKNILDDQGNLKLSQIKLSKVPDIVDEVFKEFDASGSGKLTDPDTEMSAPIEGDLLEPESPMGAALKKFADAIKFQSTPVSESIGDKESDKAAMFKFLKSIKQDQATDYVKIMKNNLKPDEINGVIWWLSDKERAIRFAKRYFPESAPSLTRAAGSYLTIMDDFKDELKSANSDTSTLEEALKPIIDQTIKEILQK